MTLNTFFFFCYSVFIYTYSYIFIPKNENSIEFLFCCWSCSCCCCHYIWRYEGEKKNINFFNVCGKNGKKKLYSSVLNVTKAQTLLYMGIQQQQKNGLLILEFESLKQVSEIFLKLRFSFFSFYESFFFSNFVVI